MISPFSFLKEERKPASLVVDDLQPNLELMEAVFLREGFQVHTASNAEAAFEIYSKNPIDIAVLDVMMPGVNGFEICRKLKGLTEKEYLPVILVTALSDKRSRLTGLEAGADDFISKPFDAEELMTKVRSLLKQKELHEELDHSENIIFSLVVTMEARDPYTKGHSARVGELAGDFGSFLGLSDKERDFIKKAGILHDVGKLGLSESILRKPARLSQDESETVRKHPLIGEDICRPLKSLQKVLPGVRHHHERWDGSGYPDNLAGEDIPLMARMLSILDSFDAMVSIRPYRDKRTFEVVINTMEKEHYNGQWDPNLLDIFFRMMRDVSIENYSYV